MTRWALVVLALFAVGCKKELDPVVCWTAKIEESFDRELRGRLTLHLKSGKTILGPYFRDLMLLNHWSDEQDLKECEEK